MNEANEQFNNGDSFPSLLPDVPSEVAQEFLLGLNDGKNGRVVDADAVIAEGRRLIILYQENKNGLLSNIAVIPAVCGLIDGIPIEDMEAWEDAQNEGIQLPEPKPRRIE